MLQYVLQYNKRMPEIAHKQRLRMDFHSILLVWSLVSSFAFKSEALATSFVPRSLRHSTRGGSSAAASLLQESPTNGEWDISLTDNLGNSKGSNANSNAKSNSCQVDQSVDAEFVAETNLPTDVGAFRLRAYRIPQSDNAFVGTEPCVIYASDKPPFGVDGGFAQGVPIRVHDQCLTSEVFRSQRYAFYHRHTMPCDCTLLTPSMPASGATARNN